MLCDSPVGCSASLGDRSPGLCSQMLLNAGKVSGDLPLGCGHRGQQPKEPDGERNWHEPRNGDQKDHQQGLPSAHISESHGVASHAKCMVT